MIEPLLSTMEAAPHALPSGLIHNLRSPLNVIIGYSEMLIEQAEEQGQNDLVPDQQKILTAGKQLLTLINESFHAIRTLAEPAGTTVILEEQATAVERETGAEEFPPGTSAGKPPSEVAHGYLLVVDDIEGNRDVLSRRLRGQGYVVATAENGRQALEKLRAQAFDLVLLDILMPEMNGYEVLEHLKADEALRHVPVIMITALNELDSAVRCIEMGAEDYLPKPFDPILLKARIGACLQKKRAKEVERELAAAKQLLETSRQAGMAEVATSILHNVGNVLNSVNVSSGVILDKVQKSKVSGFTRAVTLLEAHQSDLPGFFRDDPKGKQLLGYLIKLDTHLVHEQKEIMREVHTLMDNILHIKEIVAMQQDHARASDVLETLSIQDLVEDSLRLNSGALDRHAIKLVREYTEMNPILVDKHKVLQILINLIRNAKHSFDHSGVKDKQITLRITKEDNRVKISVIDNGIGIPSENLIRIFNHGFTTKKNGHGFGLHSGALTAKEIGGTLTAFSAGTEAGSTFTLEIPVSAKAPLNQRSP